MDKPINILGTTEERMSKWKVGQKHWEIERWKMTQEIKEDTGFRAKVWHIQQSHGKIQKTEWDRGNIKRDDG